MCTVTVVPLADGLRLMCNRDERHERAAALPPAMDRYGDRTGLAPIDPDGGGSWIGVNDAGLALVLLNRQKTCPTSRRRTSSRGLIVTRLLRLATLDAIEQDALSIAAANYEPFRFVALRGLRALIGESRGERIVVRPFDVVRPRMLTSSSVQPAAAAALRAARFRTMVLRHAGDREERQHAFHNHQNPERPEVSVLMRRADARTVSRTTVDMGARGATLIYEPLDPCSRAVRRHICF